MELDSLEYILCSESKHITEGPKLANWQYTIVIKAHSG